MTFMRQLYLYHSPGRDVAATRKDLARTIHSCTLHFWLDSLHIRCILQAMTRDGTYGSAIGLYCDKGLVMSDEQPRKPVKIGVKEGDGPPPGYLWNVVILTQAFEESKDFLDADQY